MGNSKHNTKPKLLLVEPDEFIRNALRAAFYRMGYYIVAVDSKIHGQQILDVKCLDVIICDFDLYDGSGMEFLVSIKNVCPEKTTVLMITYGDLDNHSEAVKQGINHVVEKPFLFEKLLRIIENVHKHKLVA
jgi:DNA-binding NtrC family response regulator